MFQSRTPSGSNLADLSHIHTDYNILLLTWNITLKKKTNGGILMVWHSGFGYGKEELSGMF